jgi:hypothetical protein
LLTQAVRLLGVSRPTNRESERPAMPVTEFERHQLFTWFEEHMGKERAATMMNLVPPVGWAEVATRHDLDELEARLTTRIDALESKFDSRFEALENRFDAKLNSLRSELLRTLGTWLFASQAAVIAAISVVIALVALG